MQDIELAPKSFLDVINSSVPAIPLLTKVVCLDQVSPSYPGWANFSYIPLQNVANLYLTENKKLVRLEGLFS